MSDNKKQNKQRMLEAYSQKKEFITVKEAASVAKVNHNTARWCSLRLLKEGKIERSKEKRGLYRCVAKS